MTGRAYDAVVVGAGPNGLAAAITLARAGRSVLVVEADTTAGGGARSAELTLPGFVHDPCSTAHPMARASPLFRDLRLEDEGLSWVQPDVPLAHPLDDSRAVVLHRSVEETAAQFGGDDGYLRLMAPIARGWQAIVRDLVGPLRVPRHPVQALRFAMRGLRPASSLARRRLRDPAARALLAGVALHAGMPLDRRPTAAFGLLLAALGHAVGWPFVEGGSGRLADALVARLASLGGTLVTGVRVTHLDQLPRADAYLFDVSPRAVARIGGTRFPEAYRRRLERYRYGQGVCKVDYAVTEPPPWSASACARAGTVHLGGTIDDMERSELSVWSGQHAARPYVIVAQPTVFDPTRAPRGRHCVWAYCHVPAGSTADVSAAVERRIERYAPGFRDTILARHVRSAAALEAHDPNFVGGDINCGVQDLWQLVTRPVARIVPYRTPNPRVYLCSSATPPGGGVHGLCGYHAAHAALRRRA